MRHMKQIRDGVKKLHNDKIKPKKRITLTLNDDLWQEFRVSVEKDGMSGSGAIEYLIKLYLEG